jgi:surfactin synthase thioesterase subunit
VSGLSANLAEIAELWWWRRTASDVPRLRIFLFPYAGGGARIFHGWAEKFPADIELRSLQLPGRDLRHREPNLVTMEATVAAIVESMRPLIAEGKPFAFFGYSLGGLVAFEVCRRLRSLGLPQPKRLIVAAGPAPHCNHAREPLVHRMTDAELVRELRRFKGTPEIVLQTPELLDLLLPVIRADFAVLETYRCAEQPPLAVPISAYGGLSDDEVSPDELAAWSDHTNAGFQMRFIPGDHFFLKSAEPQLLDLLRRELESVERKE